MDKSKGEPVISLKTKSKERSSKSRDRKSPSKETKEILSFDQIKEQRERERQRQREREIREVERRRTDRDRDTRPDRERERIRLFREKEERKHLLRKRDYLEVDKLTERFNPQVEKQRLDAERMERQFLERERLRIEYERRREQERIMRERDELRRQQEQLRYEQDRRSLKRPYDIDSRYIVTAPSFLKAYMYQKTSWSCRVIPVYNMSMNAQIIKPLNIMNHMQSQSTYF
ncbi:scaffold attachment factor B2-like isoform X1 [Notothenia coriiceps]|uniref:Scaffold attachment factor B2-like isoform X1 n=1 Tax=Notothenia coriiceps TaxID=8208 RepID=A0A6I9ND81_9TELE|nr:PREDICTED: scaffold attachment factor B2-like isoform X1 [Notothenia coriiceps]